MKKPSYMDSTSIRAAALVFHTNHRLAGVEKKRTLWRMPDGSLALMNGAPIHASELLPGEEYQVQFHPSCSEKGMKK